MSYLSHIHDLDHGRQPQSAIAQNHILTSKVDSWLFTTSQVKFRFLTVTRWRLSVSLDLEDALRTYLTRSPPLKTGHESHLQSHSLIPIFLFVVPVSSSFILWKIWCQRFFYSGQLSESDPHLQSYVLIEIILGFGRLARPGSCDSSSVRWLMPRLAFSVIFDSSFAWSLWWTSRRAAKLVLKRMR